MATNTTDQPTSPKQEGPRSFARFIELLAEGDAHDLLSEELHKLGVTLRDESAARGKVKGELHLKLTFNVDAKGLVKISHAVTRKDPPRATSDGVQWLTKGGNFTPANPNQLDMPGIREVPKPNDEMREAAPAAPKEV